MEVIGYLGGLPSSFRMFDDGIYGAADRFLGIASFILALHRGGL